MKEERKKKKVQLDKKGGPFEQALKTSAFKLLGTHPHQLLTLLHLFPTDNRSWAMVSVNSR